MSGYQNGALRANDTGLPFSGLPLFDWAATVDPTRPRPILVIARRYGLPDATAAVVTELSGFGGFADD